MNPSKIKSQGSHNDTDVLTALLAEFGAMRAELLQVQTAQGQLVLYSLLFIGVSIPIVASLLQNSAYVSLLIIPMLFSSMAWAYLGYVGMSYRISIYINARLRPAIHNVLQLEDAAGIMSWEEFARSDGLSILALPKGFEILLFILPSVGSISLFFYLTGILKISLRTVDWILFGIAAALTLGAIVMAVVVVQIGFAHLVDRKKSEPADSHPLRTSARL